METRRPPRVLVAEDDYLVSETIAHVLKEIGCELVGTAADGRQAAEMVCALHPDVVLMDIRMPDVDGLEAARNIQECCPTPVIILTAYESKELVDRASETGVSAYLSKPPVAQEIDRAITIALARHGDLVALRHANEELAAKNAALQDAMEEIRTLRGILPLCMFCKKVRIDEDYWQQVDIYINEHTDAEVSHGLCPECYAEHYPDHGGS